MKAREVFRMNKLIEKIVERLKKLKEFYLGDDDWDVAHISAYQEAIDIIHEEAKAYNEEVCEWKLETEKGVAWHCNGCEAYNFNYATNLKIIADDFECKCPYCGKKIKVVE